MKLPRSIHHALHESDLEFDGAFAAWLAFTVLLIAFLLQRA